MRPAFFDSQEYKKKQANIAHINWNKGLYVSLVKKETRHCLNYYCKNYFVVSPSDKQKYCSQKCWNLVKRNYQPKITLNCLSCAKPIIQKGAFKFCSIKCQATHNYSVYIERWKQGLEDGNIGITTKLIAGPVRRYIWRKFKESCAKCGWNQKNPITNKTPLEINHIDGNSNNNKEYNLELICPNCHSLTPNFRGLNKGNGRKWRLDKIHNSIAQVS